MKNSMKYWLIVAMVLIAATLLVSGNAGAVIVAPQPGTTVVIGTMPVASPVFGSGIASGVLAPRPFFGQPFVRPFFPFFRPFPFFNPFNPFFDEEPFFGFGVNEGFVD